MLHKRTCISCCPILWGGTCKHSLENSSCSSDTLQDSLDNLSGVIKELGSKKGRKSSTVCLWLQLSSRRWWCHSCLYCSCESLWVGNSGRSIHFGRNRTKELWYDHLVKKLWTMTNSTSSFCIKLVYLLCLHFPFSICSSPRCYKTNQTKYFFST